MGVEDSNIKEDVLLSHYHIIDLDSRTTYFFDNKSKRIIKKLKGIN